MFRAWRLLAGDKLDSSVRGSLGRGRLKAVEVLAENLIVEVAVCVKVVVACTATQLLCIG
jgi:hypothetical protein